MRAKLIPTLFGAVIATWLVASPASAAPPAVVYEEDFDNTWFVPDDPVCGVDITIHEVGTGKVTEFYDNDGDVTRVRVHSMGTTTRTTDFGQVVDRWSVNHTFDPETLTETTVGNVFNTHAGAGGVLVNDSGRLVIDVITGDELAVNGPHEAWFGEFDDACAVLAP